MRKSKGSGEIRSSRERRRRIQMICTNTTTSGNTMPQVLRPWGRSPPASRFEDERIGVLLQAHSIVGGAASNLFVGYVIVDLYIKFTRAELARKVFDVVLERDTVLWNTENPMSIEVKLKHKDKSVKR
ncbi:Pentatricopeptide repeat-containing protein, partial [Cucurbita argyrosperma subsp. argyrosperma]